MNSDNIKLILKIRKRLKWLIIIAASITTIYFYLYQSEYHSFQTQTTFIVNYDVMNMGVANYSSLSGTEIPTSGAENRLFAIFNSNALRDSLIYKLDLMHHYNIKPTTSYKYEKTLKKIEKTIQLKKIDNNLFKIMVSDKERVMGATIADEAARMINVISKDLMLKNIRAKTFKLQSLNDTLKKQNIILRSKQYELLERISPEERKVVQVEKRISEIMGNLNTTISENNHEIESNKFILNNYAKIDLNAITVINRAIPDTRFGYDILGALMVVVYIFGGVIGLFVLLLFAYESNKEYLRILLKGE